jgi:hypothetical protein
LDVPFGLKTFKFDVGPQPELKGQNKGRNCFKEKYLPFVIKIKLIKVF